MEKLKTENRPTSENIVEFINGIQSIDDKSVFLDLSELPKRSIDRYLRLDSYVSAPKI